MSDEWDRFNSQFEESMDAVRERQRRMRVGRTAKGLCWQCAKPITDCRCPNVKHNLTTVASPPSA